MSPPTETVTARWRSQLQVPAGGRAHWDTRAAYYRAVCELLADDVPVTWERVVAAVRPHGSRTTFYDVAGARAKHPLLGALLEAGTPGSLTLVWAYRRDRAVPTLVDEAKVWSFWPYREAWLAATRGSAGPAGSAGAASSAGLAGSSGSVGSAGSVASAGLAGSVASAGLAGSVTCAGSAGDRAGRLCEAVAAWALRHPMVARANDGAPPICAVEDLVAVSWPKVGVRDSVERLAAAMRRKDPGTSEDPPGMFPPSRRVAHWDLRPSSMY